MKEMESLLKTFADGLKTLAQGVAAVACKLEEFSKAEPEAEPEAKPKAKAKPGPKPGRKPGPKPGPKPGSKPGPKPGAKKKAAPAKKTRAPRRKKIIAKKPGPKKKARGDASEAVLKLVANVKEGVKTAYLKEETGFDDKKIRNIIYKLKKQERIKSAQRGVYVKA